jgi:DNA polymerase III delta subunit
MPNSSSKNVFIFFGEDDFGLRQKINVWKDEFAKKFSAAGVVAMASDGLSEPDLAKKLGEVLAPSLFSTKKLVIARNFLPSKSSQEILINSLNKLLQNIPADYFLVFWQDSLDRRIGFNKNLAKEINLVEFHLPHGLELNSWIKKQSSILGLNLDNQAIEKLAVLSGRDLFEEKKAGGRVIERKEFFDLWQVHSELQKLAAFSNSPTAKEIGELVVPAVSENVFALSDALVSQNKKHALEVLENLMREENTDEKSMSIKLIGLISEQIRSQLVVSLLKSQNMDQNQIASFLGWSPGRVYITLKNSAQSRVDKLKKLMARLLEADALIKSSDTNPKLLIDQLLAS